MARRKGTGRRRKSSGRRRAGQRIEIVSLPLTRSGHDYLTAVWPALLEGAIGNHEIKPDALRLLRALNRVATGGVLGADPDVRGGVPAKLNARLDQAIEDANYVNDQLGSIQVRS